MEKLVEAGSFPNVELGGAVAYTPKPDQLALDLSVENTGVGPARIQSIELWDNGKPLRSVEEIGAAIKSAGDGVHGNAELEGATVIGSLLGAGKSKTFVRFKFTGIKTWFPVLSKTLFGFESRVCYCSVFDECHVSDSRVSKGRPVSVGECPIPSVPFDDNISSLAHLQAAMRR